MEKALRSRLIMFFPKHNTIYSLKFYVKLHAINYLRSTLFSTYYICNAVIQKHIPAISEIGVITYFSFILFEIMFIIVFKDR